MAPVNAKQRAQAIAEWRGMPERLPAPDRWTSAGDALQKVLAKLGLEERIGQEAVLAAWQEVVGEFIATHATPSRLHNGTLVVQVLQPAMRYELDRVWKPRILEKLQSRFGKKRIRAIRICVG